MIETLDLLPIIALLPLTACMLVLQQNPYHALVIRGILGAVSALVYALLGAADVALTEAMVGTMLSITLYAVAVRSSLTMRLGVIYPGSDLLPGVPLAHTQDPSWLSRSFLSQLRQILKKYYLRLEIIPYLDLDALQTALSTKEVHTILLTADPSTASDTMTCYHLQTRLKRLYTLMNSELPKTTQLTYSQSQRLKNYSSDGSNPMET
jgi:putative multicomponent Na+:H+ antiporter subunit B